MNRVTAIESQVMHLSDEELEAFKTWFERFGDDASEQSSEVDAETGSSAGEAVMAPSLQVGQVFHLEADHERTA